VHIELHLLNKSVMQHYDSYMGPYTINVNNGDQGSGNNMHMGAVIVSCTHLDALDSRQQVLLKYCLNSWLTVRGQLQAHTIQNLIHSMDVGYTV
jgi:hypothetical protein